MAVAYGMDSHRLAFMTEAQLYFLLLVVGVILALTSSERYTRNTKYGEEDLVIVPGGSNPSEAAVVSPEVLVAKDRTTITERDLVSKKQLDDIVNS